MLELFSAIWDGHLEKMIFPKHQVDLEPGESFANSSYRVGQKAPNFQPVELSKTLGQKKIIVVAITEWAAPIEIVTNKDGSLHFFVEYRMLGALIQRDSYPIEHMGVCIAPLHNLLSFPH